MSGTGPGALVTNSLRVAIDGAVNAIVWTAHGGRTAALEAAWRRMRGSHIGLHWMTLALRLAGIIAVSIGLLEFVLTFAGTRALSGSYWLWRKWSGRVDMWPPRSERIPRQP